MKLTVIVEDSIICIDGECINGCDLRFIPTNIHAIQWYGTHGQIEYKDKPNEFIESINFFEKIIDSFEEKKEKNISDKKLEEYQIKIEIESMKNEEKLKRERIQNDLEKSNAERIKEMELKIKQEKEQEEEKAKKEKEEYEKQLQEYENNRNYDQEFRDIRNNLLYLSDWTQLDNSPLSPEKKIEWENYRKILRDLTENFIDFRSAVNDKKHPIWPIPPK